MKAEAKWRADANGRWYTIKAAPGYAVGWKQIGKYTYYFEKNKYAVTGWKLIDKKWYYFDIKGRLLANRWVDGYYLSADGSMAASTVITSGVKVTRLMQTETLSGILLLQTVLTS